MFGWLKNLFSDNTRPTIERPVVTPTVDAMLKVKPKKSAIAGRKSDKKDTKTDLNKMTKVQLEAYAKKEFKIDLDRRKKKADLVAEVAKLAKK